MTTDTNTLQQLVKESGLEQSKAQFILSQFGNFFDIAASWERRAAEIQVKSAEDVEAMQEARAGRLILKQKRVEVEKARITLKEQSLREGKTIDGIANILKNLIAPIEQDLEQKEKFVEIQEEKRRQVLVLERSAKLRAEDTDPAFYELSTMPEEQFELLLQGARAAKEAKIEEAKKAEAQRAAKEAEDRRIREENERLKVEKDAQERQAANLLREQQERERQIRDEEEQKRKNIQREAQRKIREEQERRAELEAKENVRLAAEEAERKRIQVEERAAKRAPDKQKILAFADTLRKLEYPEVRSEEAEAVMQKIDTQIGLLIAYIKGEAEKM